MTAVEKAQRFLRTNGVWDMSYADGKKLSERLAKFVEDETTEVVRAWWRDAARHLQTPVAYNVDGEGD